MKFLLVFTSILIKLEKKSSDDKRTPSVIFDLPGIWNNVAAMLPAGFLRS